MLPRSQEHAVVKIPPPLVSYEDACAIIVPGMTAWHALIEAARLSPGEKILIYSAAGATEQLAVQVAKAPRVDGEKGGETGEVNFAALFRRAKTHEERSGIVAQAVQRRLARALGIESEDIDVEKPLHAYGVDSLVAVELRNLIANDFAAEVPVFELVSGQTVRSVADLVEDCSHVEFEGKTLSIVRINPLFSDPMPLKKQEAGN